MSVLQTTPASQAVPHPMVELRHRALLWVAAPLVSLALVGSAQGAGGPTICPVRLCTGHACPGCGLTRSITSGLKGELALSLRYHPVGLLIAFQLLVAWAVLAFGWKKASLGRLLPLTLVGNAVVLIGVWLVRWRFGLLDFVLAD